MSEYLQKLKRLGNTLKTVVRGAQGLPPEDPKFYGLIRVDETDSIERTVVTPRAIPARIFFRYLASIGNENFQGFEDIAEYYDRYGIAKDGQQWDKAVALAQSRQAVQVQPVMVSQPQKEETKKKGRFKR